MKFILSLFAIVIATQITVQAQTSHTDKLIASSEARVQKILEEIIDLDREIEGAIQKLVDLLAKHTDSEASKTRVTDSKLKAIEALRESIDDYVRLRKTAEADLKKYYSSISEEDLKARIKNLDNRIDKRVDQILQLSATFEKHKGYDKYNKSYNWNGYVYTERNSKEKHNNRVANKGSQQNEKLYEDLQKAITDLEKRNRLLDSQMDRTRDPKKIEQLSEEINANNDRIYAREAQLEKLIGSTKTSSGQPLGQREAHNLEKMIRDTAGRYRTRISRLKSLRVKLDQERTRLESYKRSKARAEGTLNN